MLEQMAVEEINLELAGGCAMTIFTTQARSRYGWLTDAVLLILIFIVFYMLFRLGEGMVVPFSPEQQPVVDLAPASLPYYAGRSLLRMFLAFGASLLFSLVYGYMGPRADWRAMCWCRCWTFFSRYRYWAFCRQPLRRSLRSSPAACLGWSALRFLRSLRDRPGI